MIRVHLKKEYACQFLGTVKVTVTATQGIKRDYDDWRKIERNARYDSEIFNVHFVEGEEGTCGCKECKNQDMWELYLSFEDGVMWLREGPLTRYSVEYLYEFKRYVFQRNGKTEFYPTALNSYNDPTLKPPKESMCYLTPVFHDDHENKCWTKVGHELTPTGKCPYGVISVK